MQAARKHTTVALVSLALLAALVFSGSAGSIRFPGGKRDRQAPTAAANVRVTSTEATTVSLAWDPATDNVGVAFYYVYVDGVRTRVDGTRHIASDLECGQSIGVWVVAYDFSRNRSASTAATVSTAACPDLEPPTPPSGFRQAATTQDAVVLEWDSSVDNVGVVRYGVYRNQLPVQSPSQPSATLTGLTCGATFEYQFDAVDPAGNRSELRSAWVQTARCSVLPTPPPPSPDTTPPSQPANLAVGGVTGTAVSLTWSAATDNVGVAGYDVYRDGTKMTSVTSTSSNQSDLVCGTSYWFGVQAVDAAGNRSPRVHVNPTTSACPPPSPPPPSGDTTPPSQPATLAVASVTQTSVSLTWSASSDNVGVIGYRVYVNGVGVLNPAQPGATVTALACGTAFTFEVDAADGAGNRSSRARVTASTSACADAQGPTAPTNVAASSRTATSIALTWSASTDNVGVTAYGLYRAGSLVDTSQTTTGIFTGLTCNTNYTLAVDATDAAANRSAKATVMVATTACPDTSPPSSPTGLAASDVTQTSLTLNWNASTDNVAVTGYDVYRNGTKMASVSSPSSNQSGLGCATSNWFGVEALDAAGNRSARVSVNATTSACSAPPLPPPPPPPPPSAGQLTGTHWAETNEYGTLKDIGYGFAVTNVAPGDVAGAKAKLDAAKAAGIKLIIGMYHFGGPHPYSYANGQWTISPAAQTVLDYLESREQDILAFFGFNEPYWLNVFTEQTDPCGAHSAAQLRAFRDKIRTVWPTAKVFHDIGAPAAWAPGGFVQVQNPCVGTKYADQSGVVDYAGIWDYPFRTSGYRKAEALATLTRESSYVVNEMQAVPVWLGQSHSGVEDLAWPTSAQLQDWNCAIRAALPAGSLISWYVWRQEMYPDYLANHPEMWPKTTQAVCP